VTPQARAAEQVMAGEPCELTVLAAASLTECIDAFVTQFEASHPDIKVKANYAGTQELRIQVEQGAPCDVFLSASKSHMEALTEGGHVKDTRVLAHNKLCVITDRKGGKVKQLGDLTQEGLRVVVATAECPVGRYTRDCWANMSEAEDFGAAFIAGLQRNVVSEETNVKLVVSKVALGEGDAGFVYASDALGQDVDVIGLPEEIQVRATYMIGIGSETSVPDQATTFIEALLGEPGEEALASVGLELPE